MNSKKHLDFGGVAMDVGRTVEEALSRSEARTKRQSQNLADAPSKTSSVLSASAAPEQSSESTDKKQSSQERRKRTAKKNEAEAAEPKTDPWVNATFKVRDSKRQRLHRLHLKRQLAGLSPFTKQDFLDEALDYVLTKYEGRQKSRVAAD